MTDVNEEVAELLLEFADRLEAMDVEFKPRAYRDAAESVLAAGEAELDEPEELEDVGEAIGSKITEYLETGSVQELDELRDELPVDIRELTAVEGVGPKTVGKLYRALDVTDLDELEQAARDGRIAEVEGFGERTQANLLEGIAHARKSHERMLLDEAEEAADTVLEAVDALDDVVEREIAGSYRRRRETVGDLDVVCVAGDREAVVDGVAEAASEVLQRGETKSSYRFDDVRLDLHLVESGEFGSALQYFTGSKQHNVELRNHAISLGYKLNEYGVWDGDERIASETEEDVYAALDLSYVEPELRERRGEIQAALDGDLPALVGYDEPRGDLHVHTDATDGRASLEEMVDAAVEYGHDYVAVTDHAEALGVAGGLSDDELLELAAEVREIDDGRGDVSVYTGVEANLLKDGSLDVGDDVMEELDVVVASIHSGFRMTPEEATERLVSGVRHDGVDVVGHPSGRLLNSRSGYDYDVDALLEVCRDEDVAVEVNSNPRRLDARDIDVRRAVERDVPVVVSTDAHSPEAYAYQQYGVATARRGWAEADDVLNTKSPGE
ncbi:MAG: DNA polymerase/3'-5' exonuclease PolX, partial [Halobacteriales archaeon]